LKKILGESAPTASAWQVNGAGSSGPNPQIPGEDARDGASGEVGSGKGKKGKGKQKQMLFTLGTFPS
jgi:E3 ubiquitin-protein ligase ZNF598